MIFSLQRVTIRLFWMAVASNAAALGILFRGIVIPMGRSERLLAVMFTAISTVCWVLYFCKLKRVVSPKRRRQRQRGEVNTRR